MCWGEGSKLTALRSQHTWWRSEANFQESEISFYHVGPRDGTQVVRLGGRYFLRHLSRPLSPFYPAHGMGFPHQLTEGKQLPMDVPSDLLPS